MPRKKMFRVLGKTFRFSPVMVVLAGVSSNRLWKLAAQGRQLKGKGTRDKGKGRDGEMKKKEGRGLSLLSHNVFRHG